MTMQWKALLVDPGDLCDRTIFRYQQPFMLHSYLNILRKNVCLTVKMEFRLSKENAVHPFSIAFLTVNDVSGG